MALADDIAVLGQAPLFHLLEPDALRLLAFAAEQRTLEEGEALFRKDAPSDGGYVVARGALALHGGGENAPPDFVAQPGALIGRSALFFPHGRPATAVAQEPSTVMRISPALMRRVLEEFPAAAEAIQDVLAAELSGLSEDLEGVRAMIVAIDAER